MASSKKQKKQKKVVCGSITTAFPDDMPPTTELRSAGRVWLVVHRSDGRVCEYVLRGVKVMDTDLR